MDLKTHFIICRSPMILKPKTKVSFHFYSVVNLVLEQVVTETLHPENQTSKPIFLFKGFSGMFNWFKVLRNLKDDKILELNGADYTLYLIFLRYTAVLFFVISVYNCIFMIPMYVTGTPAPELRNQTVTIMNDITVLNITA